MERMNKVLANTKNNESPEIDNGNQVSHASSRIRNLLFAGALAGSITVAPAAVAEEQAIASHEDTSSANHLSEDHQASGHHAKNMTFQAGALMDNHREFGGQAEINLAIGDHSRMHYEVIPFSYAFLSDALTAHSVGEQTHEFAAGGGLSFPVNHSLTLSILGEAGPRIMHGEGHTKTDLLAGVKGKAWLNLSESFGLYCTAGTHTIVPGISQTKLDETHIPFIAGLGAGWRF